MSSPKKTRNNLILIGQEVEWQPKADILTIRDRVQANQPNFQANANEGKYISRKQQMDLSGKNHRILSRSPLGNANRARDLASQRPKK